MQFHTIAGTTNCAIFMNIITGERRRSNKDVPTCELPRCRWQRHTVRRWLRWRWWSLLPDLTNSHFMFI